MIRLLIAALVLGLIHFWLYRRIVRAPRLTGWAARLATAALVVLWALAVIGIGTGGVLPTSWARPLAFVGLTWLAAVLYLVLGLGAIAVVLLLARLARVRAAAPADPRRRVVLRGATAAVALAAVGAAGYGVFEAARPRVVRARVPLARLPEQFSGLRVALVSDLHVGPARGAAFSARVADLVNGERPDLIVLAGDLVDGTVAHVGPDLAPLARLSAPLGVFGVAGNHEAYADDVGAWLRFWETLGIRPLRNERVELTRGGAAIDLAGVYDYSTAAPYDPDLGKALARCTRPQRRASTCSCPGTRTAGRCGRCAVPSAGSTPPCPGSTGSAARSSTPRRASAPGARPCASACRRRS
jgi:hypothetical protein